MNNRCEPFLRFRKSILYGILLSSCTTAIANEVFLEPIKVEATAYEDNYAASDASTATKTDTPLMQTPMTVEVLPKPLLQEMNVGSSSLSDVLKYSGVTSQSIGNSAESLSFRGFLTATTLWNGFRIDEIGFSGASALNTGAVWTGNVSSVELLKGPSSILYGKAEPGGAVNVITNKPQSNHTTTVTTGVGSWSNYWYGIDTTGAADKDKPLLYRLNIANEESDTWFHWNAKERS